MAKAYIHEQGKEVPITLPIKNNPISLHFLLATIGRPTLKNMVDSIIPQLQKQDYLTIVFDGPDKIGPFNPTLYQEELKTRTQATVQVIVEPTNLGAWGHAIRTKHRQLPGNYVLHCDDDDIYVKGSIALLRSVCTDPDALYVFQMLLNKRPIPSSRNIRLGNIGTPNGAIPTKYNSQATWPLIGGGDASFYTDIAKMVKRVIYVNHVIYIVRP